MTKKTILVMLALFIFAIPVLAFSWTHTFSRGQTHIFATDKFQIQAMTMDEQSRVWACYDIRNDDGYYVGVFQMDKLLATYKQFKSGNDVACRSMLVDRKGNVWVNYDDNELWMFDGKSWKMTPGIDVNVISIDNSGKIWVASNNNLNIFDGKSWTVFQANTTPLRDKKIIRLLPLRLIVKIIFG